MSWVAVAIGGSALLGYVGSQQAAGTQADAANRASGVQSQQFNQTQQNLQPWLQGGQGANTALLQLLGLGSGPTTTPGTPGHYAGSNPVQSGLWKASQSPNQQWIPGTPDQVNQGTPFNPNAQLAKPFSLADFQQSPGYQFNLEQGMNAINKGAAARGNLYAPQTLQDLGKYAQGTASNEYQNAFSNYNTNQNNLFSRLQTLSGQGANAAANLGGFGAQTAGQIGANMIGAGNAQAAGIVGGANAISGGVGDYYNYRLMQQVLGQQQRPTYGASESYASNPGAII